MARDLEVFLSVDGVPAARVLRFHATDDAARPCVAEAEVVFTDAFDLDAMIGKRAVLAFGTAGDDKWQLEGIVASVAIEGKANYGAADHGTHYTITVGSP